MGSCASRDELPGGRPKSAGSRSSSSSSSSSGRGSLSPVGYLCGPKQKVIAGVLGRYASPPGALEEDDLDQESGSQHLLCEWNLDQSKKYVIHFYYTKSNDQSNEEGISQWTRRKVYTLMYPKTSYCYECFWWPLNRFTVSGYCVSSLREFPLQAMGPTVRDQGRFLFKRAKGISIAKLIPKKLFGPQLSAIFRNFLSPLCSSGRSLSRDIIDGRLWSSLSSTNHARTMLTKKLFFVSVDSSESSGESVSGFSSSSHSYHSAIGGEVEDVITVKESVIAQPTEASSILAGTTKKTQPPVPPKPKHKPKDHSKNLPCSKVQYGSE